MAAKKAAAKKTAKKTTAKHQGRIVGELKNVPNPSGNKRITYVLNEKVMKKIAKRAKATATTSSELVREILEKASSRW